MSDRPEGRRSRRARPGTSVPNRNPASEATASMPAADADETAGKCEAIEDRVRRVEKRLAGQRRPFLLLLPRLYLRAPFLTRLPPPQGSRPVCICHDPCSPSAPVGSKARESFSPWSGCAWQ